MRFGIGLELWTGGTTEEEHYASEKKTQPNAVKPPSVPVKSDADKSQDSLSPAVKTKASSASQDSSNPIKVLEDANFSTKDLNHPNGKKAIDEDGLWCPCGTKVNYIPESQKTSAKGPDFRCSAMGQCEVGDVVDGKRFAKSWWIVDYKKETPKIWSYYVQALNGVVMPTAKGMDDIKEGEAPF